MTPAPYTFEVVRCRHVPRWRWIIYRDGVEVKRSSPDGSPSKWDTYMRGWMAALRLAKKGEQHHGMETA